jgi:Uma2 family endonuclease
MKTMATAPQHLTIEDFERLYGNENGWEYWFGKAVQKPMPTWAHAILQQLIAELIRQAGYVTGPEVDLRARPDWRPRPDVSCVGSREGRYPNTLDIAVEILSDDEGRYILEKCRNYEKVGIPQVFVLDPETHTIYEWKKGLVEVTDLRLANGITVAGETIWAEFEDRMK